MNTSATKSKRKNQKHKSELTIYKHEDKSIKNKGGI